MTSSKSSQEANQQGIFDQKGVNPEWNSHYQQVMKSLKKEMRIPIKINHIQTPHDFLLNFR